MGVRTSPHDSNHSTRRPTSLVHTLPLTPHTNIPPACSFMSLPQRGHTTGYDPDVDDRTPYQRTRFDKGLRGTKPRAHTTPRAPRTCHHSIFVYSSHTLAACALWVCAAGINVWYGHQSTTTLVCDCPMPADALNSAGIESRVWCITERRLSSLRKNFNCCLTLRGGARLQLHPDSQSGPQSGSKSAFLSPATFAGQRCAGSGDAVPM